MFEGATISWKHGVIYIHIALGFKLIYFYFACKSRLDCTHAPISQPSTNQECDPEVLFARQEKIGKGSFGEVFKG